jgi:hypothetical protein
MAARRERPVLRYRARCHEEREHADQDGEA